MQILFPKIFLQVLNPTKPATPVIILFSFFGLPYYSIKMISHIKKLLQYVVQYLGRTQTIKYFKKINSTFKNDLIKSNKKKFC